MIDKEGAQYCSLCCKHSSGNSHRTSLDHIKRLHETARGDSMLGKCQGEFARRHTKDTAGLPCKLSQVAMEHFWGNLVSDIPPAGEP